MSGAIAVFVKTPGLSPVKTRLAASLGQAWAEGFHVVAVRAVTAVVRAASATGSVQGYYAVAEQHALKHPRWSSMPRLWQGEGGLGERMARIYRELLLEHDFAMLVGADIPQMQVADLTDAAAMLTDADTARFVIGPSADGGFWLFGGNRPVPLSVWTDVGYSQADTGRVFRSYVEELGEVRTVSLLRDVDEV
ncbi:MAG: DUF2064 domain-containing protein, partial [Gammaproteobacteria bacterium]